MKKILGLLVLVGATATLSACGGLPTCNDELNECNRGGAYTEERTVRAGQRVVAPTPMPEPAPEPAPVAVAPEPAPAPVIIDDTPVMRSAEPQFTQIAK